MKGEIIFKDERWFVKHPDCQIPNGERYCERIIFTPLHPENIKLINEYSMVFDNIEARILSNPKVEFELITEDKKEYAKIKNI